MAGVVENFTRDGSMVPIRLITYALSLHNAHGHLWVTFQDVNHVHSMENLGACIGSAQFFDEIHPLYSLEKPTVCSYLQQ